MYDKYGEQSEQIINYSQCHAKASTVGKFGEVLSVGGTSRSVV